MSMMNIDEFSIGGDLPVRRLGFGAMRLTGKGVWGPPEDVPAARAVLHRVIELGINFIDTADVYGPGDNERLIRDTLRPYPAELVIGTKGGMIRSGPATSEDHRSAVDNSESHLRQAIEGSLRDLGVECIDLYQLHRVDRKIPIEDTMGLLQRLQVEGKIRHIGLSDVSVDQIERARSSVEIATVQNEYNLGTRTHDGVVNYCTKHDIGFIPFYPLKIGKLIESEELKAIARREGVAPSGIALAWLFKRSPVIIAIPGTSSVDHLDQNETASSVYLSTDDVDTLNILSQSFGKGSLSLQTLPTIHPTL
ncbi:aldo/keto reductase [Terriglobus saanensis]|uniref:Aldo/keto reductase n=1 Tax=Terriglobus saanensis (strain ATCC BAA-1853 / DSM 23119 / SP1PR4) TaxID=401053 RepID=E8UYD9_TERSS|nr:aldo/keto reductase [Terriglobus saanensis]ADV82027.1 aldo/keto reductase [Terriglobus saanensis SP1PR4]